MAAGQTGNSYLNVYDMDWLGFVHYSICIKRTNIDCNVAIETDKRSNNIICRCEMRFAAALCLVLLANKRHFNVLHANGQKLVN